MYTLSALILGALLGWGLCTRRKKSVLVSVTQPIQVSFVDPDYGSVFFPAKRNPKHFKLTAYVSLAHEPQIGVSYSFGPISFTASQVQLNADTWVVTAEPAVYPAVESDEDLLELVADYTVTRGWQVEDSFRYFNHSDKTLFSPEYWERYRERISEVVRQLAARKKQDRLEWFFETTAGSAMNATSFRRRAISFSLIPLPPEERAKFSPEVLKAMKSIGV